MSNQPRDGIFVSIFRRLVQQTHFAGAAPPLRHEAGGATKCLGPGIEEQGDGRLPRWEGIVERRAWKPPRASSGRYPRRWWDALWPLEAMIRMPLAQLAHHTEVPSLGRQHQSALTTFPSCDGVSHSVDVGSQ